MTKDLLNAIIAPALAFPEMLSIQKDKAGTITIWKVSVHGADYGRICGRSGTNLEAINLLVQSVDENSRVVLSPPLTRDGCVNVDLDPTWDPKPIIAMIRAWHSAAEAPGNVEMTREPRGPGIYDVFFSDPPPIEIKNALAKWASVAARANGGKVCIEGAHYAKL